MQLKTDAIPRPICRSGQTPFLHFFKFLYKAWSNSLDCSRRSPPVPLQVSGSLFYSNLNRKWREDFAKTGPLRDVIVVSISGGSRDTQVRTPLTRLDGIVPPRNGFSVSASAVPDVWLETDHQVIVWCNQLVVKVNLLYLFVSCSACASFPCFRSSFHGQGKSPFRPAVCYRFSNHLGLRSAVHVGVTICDHQNCSAHRLVLEVAFTSTSFLTFVSQTFIDTSKAAILFGEGRVELVTVLQSVLQRLFIKKSYFMFPHSLLLMHFDYLFPL